MAAETKCFNFTWIKKARNSSEIDFLIDDKCYSLWMGQHASSVEWLRFEYTRRRSRNASYSLRSFARQLAISPGALSQILARKRTLTLKQGVSLSDQLAFSADERNAFLTLIQHEQRGNLASLPTEHTFERLDSDTFDLIAEWHHFGILSLLETEHVEHSPRWIAGRLGISTVEAQAALERLIKLGFLEKKRRKYHIIRTGVATTTDIPSEAIRRMHRGSLSRAIESLESVPVNERDVSQITMAIDPAKLPEAKAVIRKFRHRMSRFLESGKKTEVYSLNIQLIPLSRPTRKTK